jgi:nitrogenase molybdenum-cofactor synthesis protein NifE
MEVIRERKDQIAVKGIDTGEIRCETKSQAGSVSQRACVFCGSRVVLYPIADALHIVHGPIGCAVYTWDIRGALSSGPELHRHSFSTDLQEMNIIYGGEKKLEETLFELIEKYSPEAAFVYSTCIIGIIGDDVSAVCKKVSLETDIPVIPVHSEGFKGTKKDGYRAACDALLQLVGTGNTDGIKRPSINILGEFNLAGESWMIQEYYRKIGVDVVSVMTGDGRVDQIRKSHGAQLNVVQCSGSMTYLAQEMERKYGIPFIRVSYFGIEDMSEALYQVADFFKDIPEIKARATKLVGEEIQGLVPVLDEYRKKLAGTKAAIYVGGAFKAFSLIKALRLLGMKVVVAGSQTGGKADYKMLQELCDPGTIIVDDSNPLELSEFVRRTGADVFIGGVKERPLAYKLGLAFVDHNHERKIALAGYKGMENFADEIYRSVKSPVWQLRRKKDLLSEYRQAATFKEAETTGGKV